MVVAYYSLMVNNIIITLWGITCFLVSHLLFVCVCVFEAANFKMYRFYLGLVLFAGLTHFGCSVKCYQCFLTEHPYYINGKLYKKSNKFSMTSQMEIVQCCQTA